MIKYQLKAKCERQVSLAESNKALIPYNQKADMAELHSGLVKVSTASKKWNPHSTRLPMLREGNKVFLRQAGWAASKGVA